jgi:2'-5' RNA ligase
MASASSAQPTPKKTRFFIALIPPPDVQGEATQLKEYFRDRYNSKAALRSPPHITLQAPFEWPDDHRDRLISALEHFSFQLSQIPIQLNGFGAFPPRVIYLDVEHTPALMKLEQELRHYLKDTLAIEDPRSRTRPFRPHLTIAFRDLKPAAFRRAWPEFEHRKAQFTFSVPAISLLLHTSREWIIHQNFPLQ